MVIADTCVEQNSKGMHSNQIEQIPKRKVALVLGCSPRAGKGRKNLYFYSRIKAAAELWHFGKAEYFLVSGDNRVDSYNEPRYMQEALMEQGVPEERIVLDYAGVRTLDSVVRAKEVFCEDQLIVVSQAFHNERAIFIGKQKGIELFGYDATDVPGGYSGKTRTREQFAKVKAFLDVFILGTQPRHLGEKVAID